MSQTIDRVLKLFSVAAIILIGIAGVYAARGLYSDGAYWLVEMLPRGGFYIFDPHRAYVQILVQIPVAVAIWLGTLDLNSLIHLHSAGFVGVPLVFWLGALALQFKNRLFWLFLMAFTVSYLRSNFFAAGEFSVAYGMTAFCTSVLLRQQISHLQAALMLLTAIVLTHSYEATLFLGAFLATLAGVRLAKVPHDRRSTRMLLVLALVIFLIAAYVGGRSVLFERSYNGKGAANLSALTEIHLLYLMAMPALIALLYTEYARGYKAWLLLSIISMAGLYILYILRWDHTNISYGYLSYAYRTLCCFLLLGVLSIAVALRFWPEVFKAVSPPVSADRYIAVGTAVFFVTLAGLMVYHTQGYYRWAQRFEQVAVSLKTNTPIDQTPINTNHGFTYGYNWGWGNPSLSILLRGNAEAMVLNHQDNQSVESSRYENVRLGDANRGEQPAQYDLYPLRPFEKKSLLFSKPN
jgi:hypothetical protein